MSDFTWNKGGHYGKPWAEHLINDATVSIANREIVCLPQWLLQLQSQEPVKNSTDFYPLRMHCNLSVTWLSAVTIFTDRKF